MSEATILGRVPDAAKYEVSLQQAARVWLRVALLSFGGPAGQIAVMHRILVEDKVWISEERFLYALNYCMLLPGPEAQQLATYIGWLMQAYRLAIAGARGPFRRTGAPWGGRVAKENRDLSIYFVALRFEFDQAGEPPLSAQLLHVGPLFAGLRCLAQTRRVAFGRMSFQRQAQQASRL
jgi:hypothetical protein